MSTSATNNGASANPNGANSRAKGEQAMQSPVFGLGVPMFRLGKAISIALRILVAVDTSVSSNADLQEAWAMYKDVVMEWSEQKRTVSESVYKLSFFQYQSSAQQTNLGNVEYAHRLQRTILLTANLNPSNE